MLASFNRVSLSESEPCYHATMHTGKFLCLSFSHLSHSSWFPGLKSFVNWCGFTCVISTVLFIAAMHPWIDYHDWLACQGWSKELLIAYFEECWVTHVMVYTNWFSWLRQRSWLVWLNCDCCIYCTVNIDIATGQHYSYYSYACL